MGNRRPGLEPDGGPRRRPFAALVATGVDLVPPDVLSAPAGLGAEGESIGVLSTSLPAEVRSRLGALPEKLRHHFKFYGKGTVTMTA